jgi:hypothetical protein
MHALASILCLFACAAVPAGEEKKTEDPTGPPPAFRFVSAVDADKGTLTFLSVETVKVPVQVTETVIVNGQNVTIAKLVFQETVRTSYVTQSTKGVQIRTASGLAFKTEEGLKRIKPGTAVLVSSNGRDVAPAYLTIVHAETIVLIGLPTVTPAVGVGGPPVPLPPIGDRAPKVLPPLPK